MKAILFDQPGGPEVLHYGDAPDPRPGAGELLVRVRATAINRADILQRRGGYPPPEGASPILGLELAGEGVLTTAGWDEKLARCRELGAEVTINYRRESFRERVAAATDGRGVNLVLDFVGAPYWDDNLAALAIDGRLALIGFLAGSRGQLDIGPILGKRLNVFGTTLRRTPLRQKIALTEAFAAFALPRFDRGELPPVIDTVLPLEQAAEAHRRMEANSNIGKIVLRV